MQNTGVAQRSQIQRQSTVPSENTMQNIDAQLKARGHPMGVPKKTRIRQNLVKKPAKKQNSVTTAGELVNRRLALSYFSPASNEP